MEKLKLRTREVVSRVRFPNFRDHGKTVDAPLLKVIASLQKKHGEAFASESGLRRMIAEDTGHCPGVDTVRRALERLERYGIVRQVWLKPGGVLPFGQVCTHGTRLVYLPQCRIERRALVARRRRDGETRRVDRRALETLAAARALIGESVPRAAPAAADFERRRRVQLAAADAWNAQQAVKPSD
jgi:hypothetical protein